LKLAAFDIETGKPVLLSDSEAERRLILTPNRSTEVCRVEIPHAESTVLVAYLYNPEMNSILARWVSWPEPYKYLRFRPDLNVEALVQEDDKVLLRTNAPVKGVMLEVPIEEGEDALWEDNFVDLVPEETVVVNVKGLNGKTVKTRWLCDWELTNLRP
jgi:beta-mannosidase